MRVLDQPHPDLAVARGALVYGLALAGHGVRISGGSAHGYYLGVEGSGAQTRAICVVPRGSQEGERHVTVLFYFFGYSQPQIARLLSLKPGTVGKRLHSARLRIRRGLPRSVRSEFVRLTPSEAFVARVARGLLDEYIGEYRFDRRPDHVVSITREGNALISRSAGQCHVLVSFADNALLTTHYDGEGRFRRDRRGRITQFVYYEFGRRLGIARKVDGSA